MVIIMGQILFSMSGCNTLDPYVLGNKKAEEEILCFPSMLVVRVAQPKKAHHHAGGLNQ